MASQIQLIAQSYLKKHSVPASEFGLAAYLRRKNGFELKTLPGQSGILLGLENRKDYLDCSAIAHKLCEDIWQHNPELAPKIMQMRAAVGVHLWVEATCPVTSETVQIDATPWHNCLNPGHRGEELARPASDSSVPISSQFGVPFAVSPIANGTITIVLSGWLPENVSLGDIHGARARARFARNAQLPKFEFNLVACVGQGFGEIFSAHDAYFQVFDIARFKSSVSAGEVFECMVGSGAVKAAFLLPPPYGEIALTKWADRRWLEVDGIFSQAMRQIDANVQWLLELMKKAAELF